MRAVAGTGAIAVGVVALLFSGQSASAIGTSVDLGTAASYSVLGGQSVTNTGPSVLGAGMGVSPGTSITGFPPGTAHGAAHAGDAEALQAQSDLVIAYNAAAAQATDEIVEGDLGNRTLVPGVYTAPSSIGLTGALTLDGQGDPNAVFVFQVGPGGLTTATSSSVVPINGTRSCNVFWQIGESATIASSTSWVGTIMALTTITVGSGATVDGRALARNGSVTLNNNVFTDGLCTTTTPPDDGTDGTGGTDTGGTDGTGGTDTGDTGGTGTGDTGGTGGTGTGDTGGTGGTGTGDTDTAGTGGTGGSGAGGSGITGSGASGNGAGTGSLAATGFELTPLVTAAGAAAFLGLALLGSTLRRPRRIRG